MDAPTSSSGVHGKGRNRLETAIETASKTEGRTMPATGLGGSPVELGRELAIPVDHLMGTVEETDLAGVKVAHVCHERPVEMTSGLCILPRVFGVGGSRRDRAGQGR